MQMYLFSQVNCRGGLLLAEMSGQSYYLSLFSLRGEKFEWLKSTIGWVALENMLELTGAQTAHYRNNTPHVV